MAVKQQSESGYSRPMHDISIPGDELGKRLGGGIPIGSIVFIEGPEGSGRSVLAQRFCYGFLQNSKSTTYVSTELTMMQFIDQMFSLSYRIDDSLIENALQFFPVYPLIGNSRSRVDFLERVFQSPSLYGKDTLIIDSFSSLVGETIDNKKCIELMGFFKKQAKLGKTIVLTAEKGSAAMDPLRLGSDIYLSLDMKHAGAGLVRMISVKRFLRAFGNVDDVLAYRVEPRSGLVIEITEVSG
jgi:archaeal flagellar protein FlaH